MELSQTVQRLSYSQTFVMSNKARELKAQGKNIISLTLGEPDFDVPEFVKIAAKKAIDDGHNHYTPVPGLLELRETICKKLKRDNGLEYSPKQVVVSNGAKQSILNVLMAVVNPGDEVILPAPYWVSYYEMVHLVNGKNVIIPTTIEQDFKITPEQLEQAITPKSKVFLFSTPSNPTGSIYTKEELKALANIFAKHPQITIISDEIYEYVNYDSPHESIAQFPEVYNQTATINGMSKSYAMTGWRLGYMAAPQWLADACDKIQGQMTSGANSVSQYASITALNNTRDALNYMIEAFYKRRELVYELLKKIRGFKVNKPPGAFYFFPDISYYIGKSIDGVAIHSSDDFAMFLLEQCGVATVGGVSFGDPNCIRFSYAASEEELTEAMHRIHQLLETAVVE